MGFCSTPKDIVSYQTQRGVLVAGEYEFERCPEGELCRDFLLWLLAKLLVNGRGCLWSGWISYLLHWFSRRVLRGLLQEWYRCRCKYRLRVASRVKLCWRRMRLSAAMQ